MDKNSINESDHPGRLTRQGTRKDQDGRSVGLRLLLLPGMDGTGRLFGPFVEQLPKDVWTKVVSYPPDRFLGYDELLPLVERQLEPSMRHVVVAESFSGPLAVQYALRRASDVAAVVLCASFVSNPLPFGLRWLARLACRPLFVLPPSAAMLRTLLLDFATPANLVCELKGAIRLVEPAVLAARLRAIASVNVIDELKEIGAPVLYLAASRDRIVGQRGARQVKSSSPTAIIRVLDAPHLILQALPREAVGAIMEFAEAEVRGTRGE